MNKRGLGFLSMALVMFFAVVGYAVSLNADFDIDTLKEGLNWTPLDLNVTDHPELGNALSYFVNGLGQAVFEFAKWTATFAQANPEIAYKGLIYLVLAALIAPIVVALIKIIVIVVILIREFVQSRKERRRYKK